MIGYLQGEILFSDGSEAVILTNSGIGHEVYCSQVLPEGKITSLFISHVIREASEVLFGFKTIREKKLFELLLKVKGVGPKSAYSLVSFLGVKAVIESINFDNKKGLAKTPGIGPKAAAQIILDLTGKIQKVNMYSGKAAKVRELSDDGAALLTEDVGPFLFEDDVANAHSDEETQVDHQILNETLMACKELGFKDDKIIPIAQKILLENTISRPEQLVHLVLKEM